MFDMRLHRLVLTGLVLISLTTVTTAELTSDDQVTLELSETEMTVGDTITATVSLANHSESNYTYQYQIGAGPYINRSQPVTNLTVSDQSAQVITVYPMQDGERVGPQDYVDINVEEVEYEITIETTPSEVTPGNVLNATVYVNGEVRDDLHYTWEEREITGGEFSSELETDGPRVTVQTRDDGQAPEDANLHVIVREEAEGEYYESTEQTITWDPVNPDVDGIEAEYSDGEADLAVTEEKLDEYPEIRLGTAIDGWSMIELLGTDVAGGTEVTLTQVDADELDVPDNLVVYSAVDITGENIDGLTIFHRANVDKDWLREHDLLVYDDQAHVSFYAIRDGEWHRLPSETGYSDLEDHVEIEQAYREDNTNEQYRLDGSTTIVLAGDTTGIDFGRFAVGPEDQCERLEEDEILPPGWEEINATCDVHRNAQQLEENLDRIAEGITNPEEEIRRGDDVEQYEPPEEFSERIEDIRNQIDAYELVEAEERMETLEEDYQEDRESWYDIQQLRNRHERRQAPLEEMNDTLEDLPEEFREQYDGLERMQNMTDSFEGALEDGNATLAEQRYEELREFGQNEERELRRMVPVAREIKNIREQDLNENQTAMIDEAEDDLIAGNIRAAEEQVREVQEQLRDDQPNIIEIIRNIIAEILGGGSPDQAVRQAPAEPQQEDRQREFSEGENGTVPPEAGPQSESREAPAQP